MNIHATPAENSQPRILMCPPRYFAVTYSINPWMDPKAWAQSAGADGGVALHAAAQRQWEGLHRALAAAGAAIEILPPEPGLPDLVFTANAAVVLDGKAVLARFRHSERQNEEPLFAAAFAALAARGLIADVVQLPAALKFEGAGDCIFDARGAACSGSAAASAPTPPPGPSSRGSSARPAWRCHWRTQTSITSTPRSARCPAGPSSLPRRVYEAALARIHEAVAPAERIALEPADARRFAANAVTVGRSIVLSSASAGLRGALERRGYAVIETPLDVFHRSGGSACCLTLRLDHRLAPAHAAAAAPALRAAAMARRR